MTAPADNRGDGGGREGKREYGSDIRAFVKAWRCFSAIPGDLPAIVAALLVIAWAIKGRLS